MSQTAAQGIGVQVFCQVIPFQKGMPIDNMQSMARGTGARYLEVIEGLTPGVWVAKQWRRQIPNRAWTLIDFGARS